MVIKVDNLDDQEELGFTPRIVARGKIVIEGVVVNDCVLSQD